MRQLIYDARWAFWTTLYFWFGVSVYRMPTWWLEDISNDYEDWRQTAARECFDTEDFNGFMIDLSACRQEYRRRMGTV